ncbi:DNA-binding protein [Cupriavidus malaysiensis]|uniref:DNA-binding protein n=1 Tax=Cupriavidus malaysiensis TaxID=367825 RepID=A0ABN4THR3_9BURK|nr:DNA-binding protein [Cupriavidus malaysiensis]AOZ06719.1 DNA-binding protein [Cupriavidus malaysiensis]
MEERLFDSSHDALRFAFSYSGQQYQASAMNKAMSPAIGSGKGLVGVDGAAQAGMIRRELGTLPELHQRVLTARAAPRELPCECRSACCMGKTLNPEWAEAIVWLTDQAMQQLSGSFSHYRVRRSILEKIFGVKIDLVQIAEDCGAHRNTVGEQNKRLKLWIEGERGRRGLNSAPGVEQVAWTAIDIRLKAAGMVKIEVAA